MATRRLYLIPSNFISFVYFFPLVTSLLRPKRFLLIYMTTRKPTEASLYRFFFFSFFVFFAKIIYFLVIIDFFIQYVMILYNAFENEFTTKTKHFKTKKLTRNNVSFLNVQ